MRPENDWFEPEKLKAYLFLSEAIVVAAVLAVMAGVGFVWAQEGIPMWALAVVGVPLVAAFAFVTWWVPAFVRTAAYRFTDEEIEYRRGVFYRQKTTVPYNRITNVNAAQGPVQRLVDAGSVGVHTAGYGGQMGAELTISGVSDYEEIKEQILAKVRRRRPETTESGESDGRDEPALPGVGTGDESQAVLTEVRRIRELLEQGRDAAGGP
jgi:membrane protein YdbS with pleckstrin-like domain